LIFDSDPRKAINLGIKNKLNHLLHPTDLLHGVRASVTKSARRMRCGCHGVSCWMPAPGNRQQVTGKSTQGAEALPCRIRRFALVKTDLKLRTKLLCLV
jgi:hypothetical protein